MVERVLSMHEAQGSIPWSSTFFEIASDPKKSFLFLNHTRLRGRLTLGVPFGIE